MRNAGLIVASLMAMSLPGLSGGTARRYEERELTPDEKEAQMRRELAECQAHKARLAAAAEKRARKAAKRLKNMPSNAELSGPRPLAAEGSRSNDVLAGTPGGKD